MEPLTLDWLPDADDYSWHANKRAWMHDGHQPFIHCSAAFVAKS
jgi:hypothetical protein